MHPGILGRFEHLLVLGTVDGHAPALEGHLVDLCHE
jgi:hypothetical protein